MKNCLMLLTVLTLLSNSFSQANNGIRVAVMTLETDSLQTLETSQIINQFRIDLLNSGYFEVISQGDMNDIFKKQGIQEKVICKTIDCILQIGQILNVDRMVSVNLNKINNTFALFVQIVDVETGQTVSTKNKNYNDYQNNIVDPFIHDIVAEFVDMERKNNKVKQDISVESDTLKTIHILTPPKSRDKALIKSFIVPGWGQQYSGHTFKAVLYRSLEILAIGGAFLANSKYNSAIDDYEPARDAYVNAIDLSEINSTRTDMLNKYNKVEDWEKRRNLYIGAAVGIWLWNACDAYLFVPKNENRTVSIRPNIHYLQENSETVVGFNINF